MIKAIFFDIGGTLRYTTKIIGRNSIIIQELMDLLHLHSSRQDFVDMLTKREESYKKWNEKTLIELTEEDLWIRFMLPDFPREFVRNNAVKCNYLWKSSRGDKSGRDDASSTLSELFRRGYRLGILSNNTSSLEVQQFIKENALDQYLSVVVLSNSFGLKKPHPAIFYKAAEEIQTPIQQCAYVGNSFSRDVIGSREAGVGEIVLIQAEESEGKAFPTALLPDHTIDKLSDLLDLYPEISVSDANDMGSVSPVLFDVALSTMWNINQTIPFAETFKVARSIGFARFELNHQISPELFELIDFSQYRIGSLHDPCPAELSLDDQKGKDWLISSLDEDCRKQGVAIATRTIDKAVALHARMVVLHPGSIVADTQMDRKLRKLFRSGESHSQEYLTLKESLIADRKRHAEPHLDAVVRSLKEIIEYTRPLGLSIGLENRYRYYDIPVLDEMEVLLALTDEEWFGFQYDVGHAQTLDRLGLCNHESWLQRYGNRMVGVHLHDVIGISDHQKPGAGEVDFRMVARYLTDSVYRTLEVSPQLSVDDISAGLETLSRFGCVNRLP